MSGGIVLWEPLAQEYPADFSPGVKANHQPGGRILGLPPLPSEKYKKNGLRDEFHKGGRLFFSEEPQIPDREIFWA
jgi:hypothetical protein